MMSANGTGGAMPQTATTEEQHTDTDTVLLRMGRIGKAFSGQPVLVDVDFELHAGEIHVLAGENGAGKSTLIKILAGVHTDYEGRIEINDRYVTFRSTHDAVRHGISVIHQELSLIPSMTVSDNIFLGREKTALAGWMRFGRQETACGDLMTQMGLDVDSGHNVEDYPLSVQQTIEIAKALSFDSRIVVMDEPTSALTDPEVERLFGIIRDLKGRGCGIIYITHKMEEIYRIADRITVLRDGKKIGTATAADLPRAKLVQWMVGRDVGEQFPRYSAEPGKVRLNVEEFTVPDPAGRPTPAVDSVTFSARAGEILGIGGLQGSGSSELLWGLFGAYGRIPRGRVYLDGNPFSVISPGHAIRNDIALLSNDRKTSGLVLAMNVTHNLTLASVPKFSPGLWIRHGRERAVAETYRRTLNIRTTGLDQPVESLSGGNQQKVVLGKWLETQPRVFLLDEPTRGVDVGAKHDIYELMSSWKADGMAIVLITSEMPELLALSDRIIVMHRGRITAEFDRSEATQEKVLQAAMGYGESAVRADEGEPKW